MLVVLASPLPLAGAADGPAPAWTRPVGGAVVQPFDAPASPYAPGHRGVDFAATPGTPVRAAGDGVVTFAGAVAGTLHVVVAHGSNLRTSYSFLARVDVRVGQHVDGGFVVGLAGNTGPGHPVGELHFGLRIGERYVDPMVLFAPPDLSTLVHLVPTGPPGGDSVPTVDDERRALRAELEASGGGGVLGALEDGLGSAIDFAGGVVSGAIDEVISGLNALAAAGNTQARALARRIATVVDGLKAMGADAVRRLAATPQGQELHDLIETGRRLVAYGRSLLHCTTDDPGADGAGGSGDLLLDVGGITTSRAQQSDTSSGIDTAKLGYQKDEVTEFSYNPNGALYTAEDTYRDLMGDAKAMAAQLQAMQRDHPGRAVDLIAHSQGGVVVDVFLQYVYKASDPSYPPIGHVVTLSSPHQGAPIATAAKEIRSGRLGRAAADRVDRSGSPLPRTHARSVAQLAESSSLMQHLWDHKLPEQIDFTSIGSPYDYTVPGNQTYVPGARNETVPVGGLFPSPGGLLDAHSAIQSDPHALQAVRAALEGRPPPCVDPVSGLRGAAVPVLITRIEHEIGDAAHAPDQPLTAVTR